MYEIIRRQSKKKTTERTREKNMLMQFKLDLIWIDRQTGQTERKKKKNRKKETDRRREKGSKTEKDIDKGRERKSE